LRSGLHTPGDDRELLERAFTAKNGTEFTRLWNGDTSGQTSHSEADLALCSHLAYWTGGDAARIDSLFRRSGLYRNKWDERRGDQTYGERTIGKANGG
jgi:putative DNA primase/helicase